MRMVPETASLEVMDSQRPGILVEDLTQSPDMSCRLYK